MKLFRSLHDLPAQFRGGAVSIGNFDGVHRGHAEIVTRLRAMAREIGGPALVFTLDPPPAELLCPERSPEPLCWTERKAELLADLGVDAVWAYPTDEAFLALEAREFFARIVRANCGPEGWSRAAISSSVIAAAARSRSWASCAARPGCRWMSSIRSNWTGRSCPVRGSARLVAAGRVREARTLLTHPYRICGPVVHGQGRGNRLGYPTANLGPMDTVLPKVGIYAGRGLVAGVAYPAAISIGPNPTFDEGP